MKKRERYSVNSGIAAVVDQQLTMELDDFGFYRAVPHSQRNSSQELVQSLEAVDAMSDSSPDETEIASELFSEVEGMSFDSNIGYYLDTYAGHVLVGDFRKVGSSGGFASWLLTKLLTTGEIDGVIHVVPASDGDGILFKYRVSKSAEQIIAGAKTRYYPAELSRTLQEVRNEEGSFAVVGIPSFITELRLLTREDPNFAKRIKYTVGLICGHQKSSKYVEALAWQHGIKPGDLNSVDFRLKVPGKQSGRYVSQFNGLIDGVEHTITKDQDELFVSDWGHSFFKAEFSDFTDDAFNETADISLGDAWLPEYINDSGGNNVIIVRHPEIARIVKDGIIDGELSLDPLDCATVAKSQAGLVHHARDEIGYRLYKRDAAAIWRPRKRKQATNSLPVLRKRVQDLREEIAKRSHIAFAEAKQQDDWNYFVTQMQPLVKKYDDTYRLLRFMNKTPRWFFSRLRKKINDLAHRYNK